MHLPRHSGHEKLHDTAGGPNWVIKPHLLSEKTGKKQIQSMGWVKTPELLPFSHLNVPAKPATEEKKKATTCQVTRTNRVNTQPTNKLKTYNSESVANESEDEKPKIKPMRANASGDGTRRPIQPTNLQYFYGQRNCRAQIWVSVRRRWENAC